MIQARSFGTPIRTATNRPRDPDFAPWVLPKWRCWFLCVALAGGGCSLEAPEAPQFETQVFLPLGVRTTSGLDLIGSDGYIEGDSSGGSPLRFVRHGALERMEAGSLLDMNLPAESFSFGLDGVALAAERPLEVSISLRSLSRQFVTFP